MSPTPRTALALGAAALLALVVPAPVAVAASAMAVAAFVTDALLARRPLRLRRALATVLARGVPTRLVVEATPHGRGRVRVRQPAVPDVRITPSAGRDRLEASVVATRRGRHALPDVAARRDGPLGLGSWAFVGAGRAEVVVYPDLPAARRLAASVRRGRYRESGRHRRGPLGLGTEFESIRDYQPDDDVRQINWPATARLGRPMSNQYRVEQDRDIVCLLDTGRLMAAPIGDRTRLDAALDAVAAVALAADELGDRAGVLAFDAEIRRSLVPRRRGADAVVRAVFDLEPRPVDSDYDLALRHVGRSKRALVLVLTDLLDESAARTLVASVPVVARHHAVVVASPRDPDVTGAVTRPPERARDVYAAAVALDVLDARARAASALARAGAQVVEATPARLGEACVDAYVRLKRTARL
jgi:uncharacterized protein (DUF58 family)